MLLCFNDIAEHLLIDGLHTTAQRNSVDISLQHHGYATRSGRSAVGIRLRIEVDQQEVAVGSHHVSLAHQLTDNLVRSVAYLILMLKDVVGNIDGVVVAAPREVRRGGRRVLVFPQPQVEIGVEVTAGGLSAELQLVGTYYRHVAVVGEVLILIGQHGAVFLTSRSNDLARRRDIEEVVATA